MIFVLTRKGINSLRLGLFTKTKLRKKSVVFARVSRSKKIKGPRLTKKVDLLHYLRVIKPKSGIK